jgi:hypothetical protein
VQKVARLGFAGALKANAIKGNALKAGCIHERIEQL